VLGEFDGRRLYIVLG